MLTDIQQSILNIDFVRPSNLPSVHHIRSPAEADRRERRDKSSRSKRDRSRSRERGHREHRERAGNLSVEAS